MGSGTLSHVFFRFRTERGIKSPEEVVARRRSLVRSALVSLLVAAGYYAGTKIGFFLTPTNTPISTFWPPNALLFAALLLTPRRMWWMLVLAVLPAHLLAQLQADVPVTRALGWFAGNTGEALLGAICITHLMREELSFASVRGLVVFLTFGVFGAPMATSFLDIAVVRLTGPGGDYGTLWMARFFSNVVANLTIVPTVVFFWSNWKHWLRNATLARWVEAAGLGLGVIFVSVLVFHRQPAAGSHISALILLIPLPILLWAAVRFDAGAVSASVLVVAFIASWNAVHGQGLPSASATEKVLYMDILLTLFALPLMVLAAVIADWGRTEGLLKNTRNKLVLEQERERYRVARELHDDLVQRLTLLGLELNQCATDLDPSTKARLQMVHDQLAGISKATRDLSHELYPFAVEYLGLVAALRTLCQRAGRHGKQKVMFSEQNVPPRLDTGISLCLYRVAQEALRNMMSHDQTRSVLVELKVERGQARLLIFGDGTGLTPEQMYSGGTGLASARERLLDLAGSFNITSAPQTGTNVNASVPLPPF